MKNQLQDNIGNYYKDFYVFRDGSLNSIIEDVYDVKVNHSGNRLFIIQNPSWAFVHIEAIGVDMHGYCVNLEGDTLWSNWNLEHNTVWAPNDSMVGVFSGMGVLDNMPRTYGEWENILEGIGCAYLGILDNDGNVIDTISMEIYPDYLPMGYISIGYIGAFRGDLGGFIRYKCYSTYPERSPISSIDTLEIYDTRDGHFNLVNRVTPFVYPEIVLLLLRESTHLSTIEFISIGVGPPRMGGLTNT